jgi:sarcosine reductase
MNLELHILNIKKVQFGERTAISDGVLYINREDLEELLEEDKRFSKVDIELVHPSEKCRLVRVFDVTEPRAKMEGTGENFPGILGRSRTVGEGRTRVLRGTAVVTIDYTAPARAQMIDMSGPIAETGIYAKLHHIVLLCRPVEGITRPDYQNALRVAGLKAAVYLAEAGQGFEADEIEVHNLGPLAEVGKGMEHLPRVAYIYQIHSLQQGIVPNEAIFYGDNAAKLLPTIVHPNEVFDGAITRNNWTRAHETYSIQNHPIIQELYKRHGKELCFVGVIVTVAYSTERDRERGVAMASKLAKSVLGADGVIITKTGGGAAHVDLGETCELCEDLGIKTTVLVQDVSQGKSSESALLFNIPRANAIVNVGSWGRGIALPPVERVIGGPVTFAGNKPAEGELEVDTNFLCGVISQIGATRLMEREF